MTFAIQGITFRTYDRATIWPSLMLATDENGRTLWVDIFDYCYDATDKSAICAARQFIGEINGRDAR